MLDNSVDNNDQFGRQNHLCISLFSSTVEQVNNLARYCTLLLRVWSNSNSERSRSSNTEKRKISLCIIMQCIKQKTVAMMLLQNTTCLKSLKSLQPI